MTAKDDRYSHWSRTPSNCEGLAAELLAVDERLRQTRALLVDLTTIIMDVCPRDELPKLAAIARRLQDSGGE